MNLEGVSRQHGKLTLPDILRKKNFEIVQLGITKQRKC